MHACMRTAPKGIFKKVMLVTRMRTKRNYIRNKNTSQINNGDTDMIFFANILLCPFAKYSCGGIC